MPLKQSGSKGAFKSNLEAEMSAGKPQKQALAIAYAVKRRNKMAKGGIAFRCPHCTELGKPCARHDGMASDLEPSLGNAQPEGHLDNEGKSHGMAQPQSHEDFSMTRMKDLEEPSSPNQDSGSPTMDRSVRGIPEQSYSPVNDIMRKRKDRGDSVARYASGGYIDPNKPQDIESQIPPHLPEGMDKSEDLDKVHSGPGMKQRYSDASESGIQSMHDYSILPESQIPQVLDSEHDSDMPDIAQQNSLIGQIMKKRRQLKRS